MIRIYIRNYPKHSNFQYDSIRSLRSKLDNLPAVQSSKINIFLERTEYKHLGDTSGHKEDLVCDVHLDIVTTLEDRRSIASALYAFFDEDKAARGLAIQFFDFNLGDNLFTDQHFSSSEDVNVDISTSDTNVQEDQSFLEAEFLSLPISYAIAIALKRAWINTPSQLLDYIAQMGRFVTYPRNIGHKRWDQLAILFAKYGHKLPPYGER